MLFKVLLCQRTTLKGKRKKGKCWNEEVMLTYENLIFINLVIGMCGDPM